MRRARIYALFNPQKAAKTRAREGAGTRRLRAPHGHIEEGVESMHTVDLSSAAVDRTDSAQIAARAQVNIRDCYQCGKCSAGCPMASGMDAGPREIVHMLQLGLVEDALRAKDPWICAQCMTCSSRCPQQIDVAELMRAVRMVSHERGYRASKESDVFETAFIEGVRGHGRNSETWLAAAYNLRSGHLLQDAGNAPKMLSKGLIGLQHENVGDREAVRRLVDRCLKKDADDAGAKAGAGKADGADVPAADVPADKTAGADTSAGADPSRDGKAGE